jgi:hypothetical protein
MSYLSSGCSPVAGDPLFTSAVRRVPEVFMSPRWTADRCRIARFCP